MRRSAEPGKGPIFKVDWSLKLLRHLTFCIVAGVTEGHRVGSSSTLPETNSSSPKNGGWKLGDFFQPVALVWVFWGVFFHDSNLWVQQKCRKISRCLDDRKKLQQRFFFLMLFFLKNAFNIVLDKVYTHIIFVHTTYRVSNDKSAFHRSVSIMVNNGPDFIDNWRWSRK